MTSGYNVFTVFRGEWRPVPGLCVCDFDWHLNHLAAEPWSLKTFGQDDYEAFMADIA